MAYVPPALRRLRQTQLKGEENASVIATTSNDVYDVYDLPSVRDIQHHFWPESRQPADAFAVSTDLQERASPPKEENTATTIKHKNQALLYDGPLLANTNKPHSTLNATQDNPDELRYILLFRNAVSIKWEPLNYI